MDRTGQATTKTPTLKLYHNNRNGTFTDVTAGAGLAVSIYGMGMAIGDYDNDGFDDIFVTALGQSRLFHNNGNGTFTDVTASAGLSGANEFSTGAAWVDYDRDGKLDLVSSIDKVSIFLLNFPAKVPIQRRQNSLIRPQWQPRHQVKKT